MLDSSSGEVKREDSGTEESRKHCLEKCWLKTNLKRKTGGYQRTVIESSLAAGDKTRNKS